MQAKSVGGMGFKKLHYFNLIMLGKQGWRLLSSPNSLVAKVLKAYYFPKTSFVGACVEHKPSYTWRSIMAAITWLFRASVFKLVMVKGL